MKLPVCLSVCLVECAQVCVSVPALLRAESQCYQKKKKKMHPWEGCTDKKWMNDCGIKKKHEAEIVCVEVIFLSVFYISFDLCCLWGPGSHSLLFSTGRSLMHYIYLILLLSVIR